MPDIKPYVGRYLIVPRATGMELCARIADALGEKPLDGHVDVLVCWVKYEPALFIVGDYAT